MSRLTLVCFLAVCFSSSPLRAAEDPDRVEKLLDAHKKMTSVLPNSACSSPADGDEIVVCGRRDGDARYRVPPSEPQVGDGKLPNGVEQQRALLNPGGRCTGLGAHGAAGCGGGLNVIAIGRALKGALDKIVSGE